MNLPPALKRVLFEDWKNVTTLGYVVELPRRPSVHDILNQYLADVLAARAEKKHASSPEEEVVLKEIVESFKRYFDRTLGLALLYKQERPQYRDLRDSYPNTPMSQLYGAEHLLRLFVKLPEIIAGGAGFDSLPSSVIFLLNSHIDSLLKYLLHRGSEVFGDYQNQTPEYMRQQMN